MVLGMKIALVAGGIVAAAGASYGTARMLHLVGDDSKSEWGLAVKVTVPDEVGKKLHSFGDKVREEMEKAKQK